MPNPYKLLHGKVGLWSRADIPTESLYRVLAHLAAPGEPRLYVQFNKNNGIVQASVSNTAHEAGFSANRVNVDALLPYRSAWVELDEETTKRCARSIKAYKISNEGLEAIAQYNAQQRYQKETLKLARKILKECRAAIRARNDN